MRGGRLLLLIAALGVGACASVSPPRPVLIGVIRDAAGPSVLKNGQRVRSGTSIFEGDHLATGAASSALVEFAHGGRLQLDEHTDPSFAFLREGFCTLIRAFGFGQLYGEGPQLCLESADGIALVVSSSVNWRIAGGRHAIVVIEGTVTMTRPVRLSLHRGQQITIVARTVSPVTTLSEAQLRAVTQWRQRLAGPPPPPPATVASVPSLVGRPLDDARRTLAGLGLALGSVTEEFTGRQPAGTVVRQTPAPGTPTGPGARMDLWVEAIEVVVSRDNARVIVDVLNAVTGDLNSVLPDLNAGDFVGAAGKLTNARARFENLERRFRSGGAGAGPLERLYELAVAGRDTQRRSLELMETMIARGRAGDTATYNRLAGDFNERQRRFNANVAEMNRLLRSLR